MVVRRAALVVALLALPFLAGCAQPSAPAALGIDAVGPEQLQAGRFYAFHHGGGSLSLAVAGNGSAEIVLYGADDTRVGRVGLGQTGGRFVVEAQPAGEMVVEVLAVNGTLDLRAGASAVARYVELTRHVERHVLLQAPRGPLAGTALSSLTGSQPASAETDLHLRRAPSALRLLLDGAASDLSVQIAGRDGTVLQAHLDADPLFAVGPSGFALQPLPAMVYEENLRGPTYTALASAAGFEGVLILEAESFSRARPVPHQAEPTQQDARFTYGLLPDQPVAFDVHRDAKTLLLWHGECDGECPDTLVALFGPDDRRVATVRLLPNATLAVPVHRPGAWVAVLLGGTATLGADRVPADFELHPLGVLASTSPAGHAGDQGNYGQAREQAAVAGVPFRVQVREDFGRGLSTTPPGFLGLLGCAPPSLRVLQGNETLAAWGFRNLEGPPLDPQSLLREGPLDLVHDDFGVGCPRFVLTVEGYQR
jgi:hypothetical protein